MKGKTQQGTTINISGLPDVLNMVSDMQHEIDYLNAFAEDVLLSVVEPETTRYRLQMEPYDEDSLVERASEALHSFLYRYRKILAFLEKNGINVDQIIGDGGVEVKTVS